jgi:hypothetical protein
MLNEIPDPLDNSSVEPIPTKAGGITGSPITKYIYWLVGIALVGGISFGAWWYWPVWFPQLYNSELVAEKNQDQSSVQTDNNLINYVMGSSTVGSGYNTYFIPDRVSFNYPKDDNWFLDDKTDADSTGVALMQGGYNGDTYGNMVMVSAYPGKLESSSDIEGEKCEATDSVQCPIMQKTPVSKSSAGRNYYYTESSTSSNKDENIKQYIYAYYVEGDDSSEPPFYWLITVLANGTENDVQVKSSGARNAAKMIADSLSDGPSLTADYVHNLPDDPSNYISAGRLPYVGTVSVDFPGSTTGMSYVPSDSSLMSYTYSYPGNWEVFSSENRLVRADSLITRNTSDYHKISQSRVTIYVGVTDYSSLYSGQSTSGNEFYKEILQGANAMEPEITQPLGKTKNGYEYSFLKFKKVACSNDEANAGFYSMFAGVFACAEARTTNQFWYEYRIDAGISENGNNQSFKIQFNHPSANATAREIANSWKLTSGEAKTSVGQHTYANEEYGFSVTFGSDLNVLMQENPYAWGQSASRQYRIGPLVSADVEINIMDKSLSVDDLIAAIKDRVSKSGSSSNPPLEVKTIEQKTINGVKFTVIPYIEGASQVGLETRIGILKSGQVFAITLRDDSTSAKAIIDSFRLIK